MKYFTPDLLIAGTSHDSSVARQSDIAWETATESYHQQLERILESAPSGVKELANLDLHDAAVLSAPTSRMLTKVDGPDAGKHVVAVATNSSSFTVIMYQAARFEHRPPAPDWDRSMHSDRLTWLYDEVRADENTRPDVYTHDILLSNGDTYEITFFDVWVHTLPLK